MLTRRLFAPWLTLTALLASVLTLGSSLTAIAESPPAGITCPPGTTWGGKSCTITVSVPGNGGASTTGAAPAPGPSVCVRQGLVVDCTYEGGWWSASRGCYVIRTPMPSDPLIPPGETDGVTGSLFMCVDPWTSTAFSFWIPKGMIPTFVDPGRMAAVLVASMTFDPIKIGSAPSATPGSVGLIGLPTWLWVQDPSATTYGPNRKGVTQNGITITAVGRVDKLVWTMGNGDAVTCTGPGTPYAASYGFSPSPDCGYRYGEPGEYDITATAWWTVTWTASTGESGSVPLRVGSRGRLVIGEVQVINR